MWKDFFYFTKSQQIAIIVLLSAIVISFIANWALNHYQTKEIQNGEAFLKEVEAFKKTLVMKDSLRDWQYQHFYPQDSKNNKQDKAERFPFDPNTADSSQLIRLGLKPYIASNLLKYRKMGGRFKTPSDFGKTYGISPQQFNELLPYIKIAPLPQANQSATKSDSTIVLQTIELNTADTTALMGIKGIGRYYAFGILKLRNELGGFHSVDQLAEVKGMRADILEKIRPYCTVNISLVRPIKINSASVEKLNAHYYLSFYEAKAIYELRRKKGKLKSAAELLEINSFTNEKIDKLQPYLSFE